MSGPRLRAVLATAALAASLAACGGGGGPAAAATSIVAGATSGAVVAAAATVGPAASGRPAGCTTGQVSANLASIEDLATAFGAAEIPNAERWAEEVDEYRPYPVDTEWAKLRKELGKYNIDPEVLDAILSCLDNH